MKLFLSGSTEPFRIKDLTPTSKRIKEFLDKSKDGELFTTNQILELANAGETSLNKTAVELPDYHHSPLGRGQKRYWGKPATIIQLRQELDAQGQRGSKRST